MSPEELKSFLLEMELEPSCAAFTVGVDRMKIRRYLDGDLYAITAEERERLKERLAPSNSRREANRLVQSALLEGTAHFVLRRSVHFQYEKEGTRKTASGTLVQIGEKLFVATARHTLPNHTQFLEFIGENTSFIEEDKNAAIGERKFKSKSAVSAIGAKGHKEFDIGFIELEPNARDVLQRDAIPLSSISVRPLQYGRFATIVGFPFEFEREIKVSPGRSLLQVRSFTYPNPVLAPEEWPPISVWDREPDEAIDCFVSYKRDDTFKTIVPVGPPSQHTMSMPDRLPAVHGMSGGGFWQSWKSLDSKSLWTPDDYELCAIQYGWHETENYIRGVQIRHWLDLVAACHDDLRPLIHSHIASQSAAHPVVNAVRTRNDLTERNVRDHN